MRIASFFFLLLLMNCAPSANPANSAAEGKNIHSANSSQKQTNLEDIPSALLPVGNYSKVDYELVIQNEKAYADFESTLEKFNIELDSLYLNLEIKNFNFTRTDNLHLSPSEALSKTLSEAPAKTPSSFPTSSTQEQTITEKTSDGHRMIKKNAQGKTATIIEYKADQLYLVKEYHYGRPGIFTGINATNISTNEKLVISIRFAEDHKKNWTTRLVSIGKSPLLEQRRTITYSDK